jgi:Gamma-glutamyltranspeptidase
MASDVPISLSPENRSQARSMVITRYGIVATRHVLASQAGAQVLARGGSAVDAAIAADAVLGVTEPMMSFSVSTQRACHILIECRVDPVVLQTLSCMGHKLEVHREYSSSMGPARLCSTILMRK